VNKNWLLWSLATFALSLSGCLVPNPIGANVDDDGDGGGAGPDELGDPSSSEGATTTGESSEDGDASSSDSMDGAMDGSVDGATDGDRDESSGDEGTAEASSDAGPDTGQAIPADMPGSQTCGNIDSLTNGCNTCLELDCCEQLLSCADNLLCACLLTCLLTGGQDEVCSLDCGGALELPSLAGILSCVQVSCAEDC